MLNGMVNTPRAGAAPRSTTDGTTPLGRLPPPAANAAFQSKVEGIHFPSTSVGAKFVRAKEAAERSHETQLLKREELHNSLLEAVEARKLRARAITEIHSEEIAAVEAELRKLEQETIQLEAQRRELCDTHRVKEVEHFTLTKKAAQTMHRRDQESSPSAMRGSGGGLFLNSASPTLTQSYQHAVYTSPFRGQGTALMASMLYPNVRSSSSFGFGDKQVSLRERYAEEEREQLHARLRDVDRVAAELERECIANESSIEEAKREREGLADILAVLQGDLAVLEKEAPDVAANLAEAKMAMKLAGGHQSQLPELQRIVDDNQMTLNLLKADFGEVTKMLMDRIKVDDAKIKELRALDLRELARTRPEAKQEVVAGLVRGVTEENRLIEGAMRLVVERAEEQRTQLESTVAMLKRRNDFLEGDLRATMSAVNAATQQHHQRHEHAVPSQLDGATPHPVHRPTSHHMSPAFDLNTTNLGLSPYGIDTASPALGALSSPIPVAAQPHHVNNSTAAASPSTSSTAPSPGGMSPSPYGGALRGFGDRARAEGVHRRVL